MTEVFVGCGSNIEPVRHLRWALGELERHFGVLRCSAIYRSPAYGFDGPDFLNMVVGFTSAGDADAIESVLSALENACGRDVGGRTGSRTLDLDLLIFGERVDAERRLPRVDVLRYPFVLAPLTEIAPDLRHPVTGETVGAVWHRNAAAVDSLTRLDALDAA